MQKEQDLKIFKSLINFYVTYYQIKQKNRTLTVNIEILSKFAKILRDFKNLNGTDYYDDWVIKVITAGSLYNTEWGTKWVH